MAVLPKLDGSNHWTDPMGILSCESETTLAPYRVVTHKWYGRPEVGIFIKYHFLKNGSVRGEKKGSPRTPFQRKRNGMVGLTILNLFLWFAKPNPLYLLANPRERNKIFNPTRKTGD